MKTAAVVGKKKPKRHILIINQVYGGGEKEKHRYPQALLNLQSNRRGYRTERLYQQHLSGSTQKQLTELTGTVASRRLYLIKGQEEKTSADLICTIEKADQEWDLAISNKQYRILLKKGEE